MHIPHRLSELEQDQLATYRLILTAIPGLEEQARYTLEYDFPRLGDLASFVRTRFCLLSHSSSLIKLEDAGSKHRTADFAKLRSHAHWYIPSIEGYSDITFKFRTTLDNSGYNNIATGRLLCPQRLRDCFDKNKEGFCRSVRDGDRVFGLRDWPSFLYQESGYNPDAVEKGLLRGPFLVYVSPPIICIRSADLSIVLPSHI